MFGEVERSPDGGELDDLEPARVVGACAESGYRLCFQFRMTMTGEALLSSTEEFITND